MSKIKDFNLLKIGDNTVYNTRTLELDRVSKVKNINYDDRSNNSVNVVISNDRKCETSYQVQYPPVSPIDSQIPSTPSDVNRILPKEVNLEQTIQLPSTTLGVENNVQTLTNQINELTTNINFYKLLSSILSEILKNNNPKLIVNLFDTSGKIIIEGNKLVQLISLLIHKDTSTINIQYIDEEPICIPKISHIKNISNIKISNESFSLKYNAEYNILKDDFNISLDKIIINND